MLIETDFSPVIITLETPEEVEDICKITKFYLDCNITDFGRTAWISAKDIYHSLGE